MKKLKLSLVICLTVCFLFLLAACGGESNKQITDGYYVLDTSNSSVTIDGVTRKLPEHLAWAGMTLVEYQNSIGSVSILIFANYFDIYSGGVAMAGGTFTMNGDNIICSSSVVDALAFLKIQDLKNKNGNISLCMVYGAYKHNHIYVKTNDIP